MNDEFRDSFHIFREDIHFTNLKAFTIQTPITTSVGKKKIPIVFGNLEEFGCGPPIGLWFDALLQNRQIKKLTTTSLTDLQFTRVTDQCPNLEEFSMNYNLYGMNSNDFMAIMQRFVEKANQLKKLTIRKMSFDEYDTLIDQLKLKWNVTIGDKEFILRRD